jgi:hypothetical protein
MADSDGVLADQDLLDHEPYDSLALKDIERVCSSAYARKERREGFGQAQEGSPISGLIGDCLQFGAQHLFALTQRRYALAQLLD